MESIIVKDLDKAYGIKQKVAKPLSLLGVAVAVFIGNLMTGILAAILYGISR
jgi:hypothetical protein